VSSNVLAVEERLFESARNNSTSSFIETSKLNTQPKVNEVLPDGMTVKKQNLLQRIDKMLPNKIES